jgi:hypothetical protein
LFPRGPARKLWARGRKEGRRKVALARFLGFGAVTSSFPWARRGACLLLAEGSERPLRAWRWSHSLRQFGWSLVTARWRQILVTAPFDSTPSCGALTG